VAAGTSKNKIKIINLASRRLEKVLLGHGHIVEDIRLSRDGKYLTSNSLEKTIKIWNWNGKPFFKDAERVLSGDNMGTSGNGKYVLLRQSDQSIGLYNWKSRKREALPLPHAAYRVIALDLSNDEQYVAAACSDSTIRVWLWNRTKPIRLIKSFGAKASTIALSPDGRYIAWGNYAGDINVRRWETGTETKQIRNAHYDQINCVRFSPDQRYVLSSSGGLFFRDISIRAWDWQAGLLFKELKGHELGIKSISISADSRFVVSGSLDAEVKVWDWQKSSRPIQSVKESGAVNGMVGFADERIITYGARDSVPRVWSRFDDYLQNKRLVCQMSDATYYVNGIGTGPVQKVLTKSENYLDMMKLINYLTNESRINAGNNYYLSIYCYEQAISAAPNDIEKKILLANKTSLAERMAKENASPPFVLLRMWWQLQRLWYAAFTST
jgi:WD40 repeat protein